jgi:hypothetical protein
MEGSDGTCEDTEDTTTLVQNEEAKCAIRKLSYVTNLSPVRAVNGMGPGWQASLSCSRCQEYGSCPKKQQPAVRLSRVHTTELAWLEELLKRLQDRHGECARAVAKTEKAKKKKECGDVWVEIPCRGSPHLCVFAVDKFLLVPCER